MQKFQRFTAFDSVSEWSDELREALEAKGF